MEKFKTEWFENGILVKEEVHDILDPCFRVYYGTWDVEMETEHQEGNEMIKLPYKNQTHITPPFVRWWFRLDESQDSIGY